MGGVPVWLNDPIPRITVGVFNYVGGVALLLVALVGVRDLRKPLWAVAAAATIVVPAIMLGVTPIGQLRELPVLRNIHFGNYYGIVLDFPLALLTAGGFKRLSQKRLMTFRGWIGVSAVLLALLTLILVALQFRRGQACRVCGLAAAVHRARRHCLCGGDPHLRRCSRHERSWPFAPCLATDVPARDRGRVERAFPPAKTVGDVGSPAGLRRIPPTKCRDGTRLHDGRRALRANAGSAFKIFQLDSLMAFNPPRIYQLYNRYAKGVMPLVFLRHASQIPPEPVLDAANVAFIAIATEPQEPLTDLKARGHALVFSDGFIKIFRRPAAPRYFFTSEFEVLSRRRALDAVGLPHAPQAIVVESQPPFESTPSGDAPVKVERFSNNYTRLSLVAPRTGFVYVSDSFFPGWRATVNGVDACHPAGQLCVQGGRCPCGPRRSRAQICAARADAGARRSAGPCCADRLPARIWHAAVRLSTPWPRPTSHQRRTGRESRSERRTAGRGTPAPRSCATRDRGTSASRTHTPRMSHLM